MASAPKVVGEEDLTPEQMKALGVDAAGVPQVVGEEDLTPEQMQTLGIEPPAPQYSPAGTYKEVDGRDAMWPGPPSTEEPPKPTNPSPMQRAAVGVRTAITEGGPLGVSEETLLGKPGTVGRTMGEAAFNAPTGNWMIDPYITSVNRALVQAPATALDVAGRVGTAAIRGLSGLAAGIAYPTDPNTANQLERDLNVVGDVTGLLGAGYRSPTEFKPKVPGAATEKLTGQIGSKIQWLGGVDPEEAAIARQLADQGVRVSPAFAPELPILRRYVDLARSLGYDPTAKSAAKYARQRIVDMLVKLDNPADDAARAASEAKARQIVNRLAAPGEIAMEESTTQLQNAAQNIQTGIESRTGMGRALEGAVRGEEADAARTQARSVADAKLGALDAAKFSLAEESKKATANADRIIDENWKRFNEMRQGAEAGDLGADFPAALQNTRRELSSAFNTAYDTALAPALDIKGDATVANPAIRRFLEDMPEEFQKAQPQLIQAVTRMANEGTATLPELQWIRTQLRGAAGDTTLNTNLKTGPFKYFSNVVNDMIFNPDAPTAWREAANNLRRVDEDYANKMDIWRDRAAGQMVANTRTGAPPDAAAIVDVLNQPKQTQRRRELLSLVPPNVRQRAAAATLDGLVSDSVSPTAYAVGETGPKLVDPTAFLNNVVKLHKDGILQDYVGNQQADQVLALARQLAQRGGAIELEAGKPSDFVRSLQHAREADTRLAEALKIDPAKVMQDEMAKADAKVKEIMSRPSEITEPPNPIDFLLKSRGATAAAEHLIQPNNVGDLKKVIDTLGYDSTAVKALQQEAAERVMQPFLEMNARKQLIPEKAGANIRMSDSTQRLLFPNLPPGEIGKLSREIRLIMGTSSQSAPSFAANTILGKPFYKRIPEQYRNELMAAIVTHPRFVKLLTGELRSNHDVFGALSKAVDDFALRNRDFMMRYGMPIAGGQNQEQPAPPRMAAPPRDISNEELGIPEFKQYAEGGLVEADLPKTTEPQEDINAQMDAVEAPDGTKDTMFVAAGSPLPEGVPHGVIIIQRPEGTLLTTNIEKARLFREKPELTDADMAMLLDYTEPKSDVQDPVVMQGVTPEGGVAAEMLASRPGAQEAANRIAEQAPGADVRMIAPEEAQNRRAGFADGGAVRAPDDLMPHFIEASAQTGVPLDYLLRVAKQESGFNPRAVSPTGARGIMQVLPSTAAKPGYGMEGMNPDQMFDPASNIMFGAKYLAARANANTGGKMNWSDPQMVAQALRSYNGPVSAGGDPNYVNAIMQGRVPTGAAPQSSGAEGAPETESGDENFSPLLLASYDGGSQDTSSENDAVEQVMPVVEALVLSGNAKQAIALLVNAGLSLQDASKVIWSVRQTGRFGTQMTAA